MARQYFRGWRAGLARCTAAAAIVTVANITFLIISVPKMDMNSYSGSEGALFSGDCKKAKQLSIWLHLAINILATVLFAAGNYTQQVLTAPTRQEIDRAHEKRQCYNSVISFETSVNYYAVYPARWKDLTTPDVEYPDERYSELRDSLDEFVRLENRQCIAAYQQPLISHWSDVILILDPSTPDAVTNYTSVEGGDPLDYIPKPYGWICKERGYERELCDASSVDPDTWTVHVSRVVPTDGYDEMAVRVAYCLRCNVLKLIGLALTWLFLEKRPLLTLGDAISSFLESPDPSTKGQCLLSKTWSHRLVWEAGPRIWQPTKQRWFTSISRRRLGITLFMCVVTIAAASYLLWKSIHDISYLGTPSIVDLWNRGFGQVNVDALFSFEFGGLKGTATMVLLSNLPQLIISLLYTAVNGMWTAMLVGLEWNGYGLRSKGLRTTYPIGQQRKTYWLSLPLRYGTPLMVGSGTLHWLISQSVFFVRLVMYGNGEYARDDDGMITTCGYSPIAIAFALALGSTVFLATVGASLKTMEPAIPPGGTCSAVTSYMLENDVLVTDPTRGNSGVGHR
ncbi:hypothetical protein F66182_8900 [Fusarium sp. NRRL 66182]|nr:hypothetical protein F66182_8900 [Fusarium sp. NRRL 66182]